MKAPKIMMALIASVVLVVLLKVFGFPGWGVLTTILLLLVSVAFIVVPIVGLIANKPSDKDGDLSLEEAILYRKEKRKLQLVMVALGIGLSVMVIGVLFKAMHWPGAMFNLRMGQAVALVGAIITIILSWRSKGDVVVKYLGLAALAFCILFGNAYLYANLDKIHNRDFKRYCEAVDAKLKNDNLENSIKLNAEVHKINALNRDAERYKRLSDLEDLAAQLVKEDEKGKVVYVLEDPWRDGLEKYFVFGLFQSQLFQMQNNRPEISLNLYVEHEVEEDDVLYVVTDEDGVKDYLVELGVDEKNIVMVGQE